jgi:hypothetical protein
MPFKDPARRREYDHARYQQKKPELNEQKARWRANNRERSLEIQRASRRRYYIRNRDLLIAKAKAAPIEQIRARTRILTEIRAGRMVRPDRCEKCSRLCKPQGHHDDYSKPLIVRWLCASCHKLEHLTTQPTPGPGGEFPE